MEIQTTPQVLATLKIGDHQYDLLDVNLKIEIDPDQSVNVPLFRDEQGRFCTLSRPASILGGYRQPESLLRLFTKNQAFSPGYHYRLETEVKSFKGKFLPLLHDRFPQTAGILSKGIRSIMLMYTESFPVASGLSRASL